MLVTLRCVSLEKPMGSVLAQKIVFQICMLLLFNIKGKVKAVRCCRVEVRQISNILVYFYTKIDYYVFLLNSKCTGCSVIHGVSLEKKIRKRKKCKLSVFE